MQNNIKSDPARALWYSIKVRDYELAHHLIGQGAALDRCYELSPNKFISTISLLTQQAAIASATKSYKSGEFRSADKLLDLILSRCSQNDLRCHCSAKYEHRCPIYCVIKGLGIINNADIMKEKNQLLMKLLLHGGTLRNANTKGQKLYPELDLEGVTHYALEKSRYSTSESFYKHNTTDKQRTKAT